MKRGSGESGGWCGCQDENGGGDDEGDLRRERNESGDGDGVMRVEFCLKGRDRSAGREGGYQTARLLRDKRASRGGSMPDREPEYLGFPSEENRYDIQLLPSPRFRGTCS